MIKRHIEDAGDDGSLLLAQCKQTHLNYSGKKVSRVNAPASCDQCNVSIFLESGSVVVSVSIYKQNWCCDSQSVLAVDRQIDTDNNISIIVENCTGVYIWRFNEVFFLSFGHIGYLRMGWRWAVAVYRGIYVLYIGRIFVLWPKVGGRRGWRSIGGRFNGVLLYIYIISNSTFCLFVCLPICLSVSVLSGPSGRNFQDTGTDVWFSVKDSKSQGAGVFAIYIPLLLQVKP